MILKNVSLQYSTYSNTSVSMAVLWQQCSYLHQYLHQDFLQLPDSLLTALLLGLTVRTAGSWTGLLMGLLTWLSSATLHSFSLIFILLQISQLIRVDCPTYLFLSMQPTPPLQLATRPMYSVLLHQLLAEFFEWPLNIIKKHFLYIFL